MNVNDMSKKNIYEEPKVEIIEFETEDVISTSDELPIQRKNSNW